MLQVLETLHLMCIYLYFYHISLQILNCIYKKFKNGKIPYSFLPSLLTCRYHILSKIFKTSLLCLIEGLD
jgi:hypothetical protein